MKYTILKNIEKHMPVSIKRAIKKPMIIHLLLNETKSSVKSLIKFLFSKHINLSFKQRIQLIKRFNKIRLNIECAHSFNELMIPTNCILSTPNHSKGCIVEAGAYKGGSTAKLSIVAKLCNRELYVFDSFEGLPNNNEPLAKTTLGYSCNFNKGEYYGTLKDVKKNISIYGEINKCIFMKGWFDDTMPNFNKDVIAVFCDVDLASSNRTCLKFMWLQMVDGGFFFSQDFHIPIVKELFTSKDFWMNEVGTDYIPKFHGVTKRFGYFIKGKKFN